MVSEDDFIQEHIQLAEKLGETVEAVKNIKEDTLELRSDVKDIREDVHIIKNTVDILAVKFDDNVKARKDEQTQASRQISLLITKRGLYIALIFGVIATVGVVLTFLHFVGGI